MLWVAALRTTCRLRASTGTPLRITAQAAAGTNVTRQFVQNGCHLRAIQTASNRVLRQQYPTSLRTTRLSQHRFTQETRRASSTDSGNALLNLGQFPDFAAIKPNNLGIAALQLLEHAQVEFDKCEPCFTPTWDGTVGRLEALEDQLERGQNVVSHLSMVQDCSEIRAIQLEIQPKFVGLSLRLQQSPKLYAALSKLRTTQSTWTALSQAQQRIVEHRLLDMKHAGIALAPASADRKQVDEIYQELALLRQKFSQNLLDATKAYARLVVCKEELDGCPDSLLQAMAAHAKQRGHGDGDKESGPWVVTLDQPTLIPFLKYCRTRDLREEVYRANNSKASAGSLDNKAIIHRILHLRQELAALLGYENFASMSLSKKMAHETSRAMALIDTVRIAARQPACEELRQLSEFACTQLGIEGPLQPWDLQYVSEQYRKSTLVYDDEQVAQYFPFPKVLSGMFALAEQLFGVSVTELEQGMHGVPSVWHKDVRVFRLDDRADGRPLAYFYGDFYSRPAEKQSGAWMDIGATRWKRNDASLRLPVAYLNCNQPRPAEEGKPALMKFSDVVTLFHEFGHCLQHMLTTVDLPQVSGVAGIEWDFIEVASQFMENFCYEEHWLRQLSAHHETGEPLPGTMVEALKQERRFLAGLATLRQLKFSHLDLALHSELMDEANPQWAFEVDQRISKSYDLVPPIQDDRFLCSFAHIFSGGYSAGYYSYKWSEVYSADAYSAFQGQSDAALLRVGRRYRDTVLALGGSARPADIWNAFMGRESADVGPLLRQDGFSAK